MSQYVISKIYANNFKGIRNRELRSIDDLSIFKFNQEGLIVLGGPNGYGKTTIFDIIEIIFAKKITRVNATKYGNRNLNESGLLNEEEKNGIIGIELISKNNQENIITVIGKIEKEMKVKDFLESMQKIKLYYILESLSDEFIDKDNQIEVSRFTPINFASEIKGLEDVKDDIYNLFYYISQEESNHFLKQKENEKVSKFDSLIGIDEIVTKKDVLSKMLTGKTRDKIYKVIEEKEVELKEKIITLNKNIEEKFQVNYFKVFDNKNKCKWDYENLSSYRIEELNEFLYCIDGMEKMLEFHNEFNTHIRIKNANKILNNKNTIFDFVEFIKMGVIDEQNNIVNLEEVNNIIKIIDEQNNIKSLNNILNKHDIEKELSFDFIEKCSKILKYNIQFSKNDFNGLVDMIKETEKIVLETEKVISDLLSIRIKFIEEVKNASSKEKIKINICPLCGTNFEEINKNLFDEINLTTKKLENATSSYSKELKRLRLELDKKLEGLKNKSVKYVENNIKILYSEENYDRLKLFFSNETSQKNLKEFLDIYSQLNNFKYKNFDEFKIDDFKVSILQEIGINSNDFINENIDEKFDLFYKDFFDNKWSSFEEFYLKMQDYKKIFEEKRKYIKNFIIELNAKEANKINKEVREIIKEIILLEKIAEELDVILKIYNTEIDNFREDVMNDIEIPLYIYTGKILQNYQRGLGVFIKSEKNLINFVPSISSEHEIINTFSSGQLSGFVIAFMLVMNKVYTTRNNQFSTILIDDPMQTMDDINIASLVDVLRKEFSDKQLILSTHEEQKAQYIMYKFLKYDIRYRYVDVKNELYSIG